MTGQTLIFYIFKIEAQHRFAKTGNIFVLARNSSIICQGMRQKMLSIHSLRKWVSYQVEYLRYCNSLTMATIGIP